jgi:signal transduction histidine kinase
MFQNLISNALKFSRDDISPVIEITSKRIAGKSFEAVAKNDGDYCMVNIQDNGIGFDGKYVDNIFSLFERLNAKDKYEGAGIGLAVAKKIAEKHDGLITAVSAEGMGAKFQIILPLKQKG